MSHAQQMTRKRRKPIAVMAGGKRYDSIKHAAMCLDVAASTVRHALKHGVKVKGVEVSRG